MYRVSHSKSVGPGLSDLENRFTFHRKVDFGDQEACYGRYIAQGLSLGVIIVSLRRNLASEAGSVTSRAIYDLQKLKVGSENPSKMTEMKQNHQNALKSLSKP